jgi:hypothetical protein
MGSKFGANPTVRTKLSIKTQADEILQEEKIEHVIWYAARDSRTRVENTSIESGYQYNI